MKPKDVITQAIRRAHSLRVVRGMATRGRIWGQWLDHGSVYVLGHKVTEKELAMLREARNA